MISISTDHNPAASYDRGTWLWALGEPLSNNHLYPVEGHIFDEGTMRFGHDRINASWDEQLVADLRS